jgi:hypothetical protein
MKLRAERLAGEMLRHLQRGKDLRYVNPCLGLTTITTVVSAALVDDRFKAIWAAIPTDGVGRELLRPESTPELTAATR